MTERQHNPQTCPRCIEHEVSLARYAERRRIRAEWRAIRLDWRILKAREWLAVRLIRMAMWLANVENEL